MDVVHSETLGKVIHKNCRLLATSIHQYVTPTSGSYLKCKDGSNKLKYMHMLVRCGSGGLTSISGPQSHGCQVTKLKENKHKDPSNDGNWSDGKRADADADPSSILAASSDARSRW